MYRTVPMLRGIALVALSLGALCTTSCKKNSSDNTGANKTFQSVNDIKVPAGFNWQSTRKIDVAAEVTDSRFGNKAHSITVYDADPYTGGGHVIARGTASTARAFAASLQVPSKLTDIYVVKSSPDGSWLMSKVAVSAAVALSFGATDPTLAAARSARTAGTTSTDCRSGCTRTITTNTTNVNVNTGDAICITGSGITVSFSSVNGGEIRVCGTNVTLQNLNLNGTAALMISSGASATLSGLNYNSNRASITNYGTLNGTFADGGLFSNYGTYNCAGDFNINSTADAFINKGTMNVSGNFNNGSKVSGYNGATLNVSGSFQQNGGSAVFVNNCALIVGGNYNQSAAVNNYNLIKVGGTATINSSTELGMYNGAMLKTKDFILDASVLKGYGSTSLVKITGSVNIRNSGAVVTGNMQICAPGAVDASRVTGGAAIACDVYIPVTSCNGEGNGTATVKDTDGDGVADDLDEYPSDAAKAYNNYYPTDAKYGTVAFEDLWPFKGDYDLNDVVVSYRYNIVTNADNNVVQVNAKYALRATGGELGNGFGVQFPTTHGSAKDVTGGTLEEGQTNAVIIVFNNMRDEMTEWNTRPGAKTSAVKDYGISFNVDKGPSLKEFGLSAYNPFIWNYGLGYYRGREVHLPGQLPTDLGDTKRYRTEDDYSSIADGLYYITKTGLPFAIDVPGDFEYPIEGVDVTKAYLYMGRWAESGGTAYTDWYSNTDKGYRETTNIYKY